MRVRLLIAPLAALLVLAGCGGGGTEAEQIAADLCDLMEDVAEGGIDVMFDEDFFEEVTALEERALDADISDEEMEAAVESECPALMQELEDMADLGM